MAKSAVFASDKATYLDVIDAARRDRGDEHAAAARRTAPKPPQSRKDYARRADLQRDLARYYERCKVQNAGRFKGERLKSYCSAVAWKVTRQSGRYPDYFADLNQGSRPMKHRTPPRDPRTGLFMKKGGGGHRSAPRRARAAAPPARRAAPRRRAVYAAPPAMPRRAPRRRAAPRRSRGSTNIAIVPVGARSPMRHSPRRRRHGAREMFAYAGGREAPRANMLGIGLLTVGVVAGAEGANIIHRYAMTYAAGQSTAPTPVRDASITTVDAYNQAALGAKPNMWSIGLQLGLAVLGFAGGAFLPWAPLRMFSYGVGIGAFGHLGVQLVNAYLIEPMFKVGTANVSPAGKRLFAFENIANPAINPSTGQTTTQAGLIGMAPAQQPSALAAAAPAGQPKDRVPASLGAPAAAPPGAPPQRQPAPVYVPPQRRPEPYPPAGGPGTGGCPSCGPTCNCAPCRSKYHGDHGHAGQPPAPEAEPQRPAAAAPPAKPAPHPLFAALRAA